MYLNVSTDKMWMSVQVGVLSVDADPRWHSHKSASVGPWTIVTATTRFCSRHIFGSKCLKNHFKLTQIIPFILTQLLSRPLKRCLRAQIAIFRHFTCIRMLHFLPFWQILQFSNINFPFPNMFINVYLLL